MEADWEIEIGGDAPVIDVSWIGFVDLRLMPDKANTLPEVLFLPSLASALVRLNAPASSFLSAKCDVWAIESVDPFEFDAPLQSAVHGLACYIDLAPFDSQNWIDPTVVGDWCKQLCLNLRASGLCCCRADLIVRRAIAKLGQESIGLSAYVSACGPTVDATKAQLAAALAVFVGAVESAGPLDASRSKIQ